jgi:septal ring factor EnvC (AmiA/AmiB activator)
MTQAEFNTCDQAQNARLRRISAENTWLRHHLMEMENRVAAMTSQLADLEARTKTLKKSLAAMPDQPETKHRSKP